MPALETGKYATAAAVVFLIVTAAIALYIAQHLA